MSEINYVPPKAARSLAQQDTLGSELSCATCNGVGLIGGFVSTESGYQSDPCPDCTPPV